MAATADNPPGIWDDTLQPTASQTASDILNGPLAVGWTGAVFGAGIVVTVAYHYIATGTLYATDSRRTRFIVWLVPVLVLWSSSINAAEIYEWLTTQKRSFDDLLGFFPADCLAGLPQGILQGVVQVVLAKRATSLIVRRRLGQATAITMYILIGISVAWSLLYVCFMFMQMAGVDYQIAPVTVNIAGAVWFCSAALIDIVILVVLVTTFRAKIAAVQQYSFASTNTLLRKLIKLSVYTQATTTIVAIGAAAACLYARSPDSVWVNVQIAFAPIVSPLYALSLFTTLNAREQIRARLQGRTEAGCTCNCHKPGCASVNRGSATGRGTGFGEGTGSAGAVGMAPVGIPDWQSYDPRMESPPVGTYRAFSLQNPPGHGKGPSSTKKSTVKRSIGFLERASSSIGSFKTIHTSTGRDERRRSSAGLSGGGTTGQATSVRDIKVEVDVVVETSGEEPPEEQTERQPWRPHISSWSDLEVNPGLGQTPQATTAHERADYFALGAMATKSSENEKLMEKEEV